MKDSRANHGYKYLCEGTVNSTSSLNHLINNPIEPLIQYPKVLKGTLQSTFDESKLANICYDPFSLSILYFNDSLNGRHTCMKTDNPYNYSSAKFELIYYSNKQVLSGGLNLHLINMRPDSSTTTSFFSYRSASSIIK
ncbi:hypothetical protein OGATHE_002645 [Ogataea polymorpha]|uniref:Uncharacterized protein n=1 Tax=Ogataea polymorpha TaxID=460523 RepID=A0A9P8PCN7_9ASCO|nr:hypothetical protein OGATHE_002645 [Ogataea polymorpha]